jgi:hypothetical protein
LKQRKKLRGIVEGKRKKKEEKLAEGVEVLEEGTVGDQAEEEK